MIVKKNPSVCGDPVAIEDEIEITLEMILAGAAAIWPAGAGWECYDCPTGAETIAEKVIEAALKVRHEKRGGSSIIGEPFGDGLLRR